MEFEGEQYPKRSLQKDSSFLLNSPSHHTRTIFGLVNAIELSWRGAQH